MKLLILNLIAVIFCLSRPAHALEVDQQDKQYHMGASYTLQTTSSMILRHHFKMRPWEAALYGALGTLAVGAAKEYAYDDRADSKDMQANLVGVFAAVPIVFFEF